MNFANQKIPNMQELKCIGTKLEILLFACNFVLLLFILNSFLNPFFRPPKAGSSYLVSYLKRFLRHNEAPENTRLHGDLMREVWYSRDFGPELGLINSDQSLELNLPSFTIVRNPIYRFVSAWREKLGPFQEGDTISGKEKIFVYFKLFLLITNFNLNFKKFRTVLGKGLLKNIG